MRTNPHFSPSVLVGIALVLLLVGVGWAFTANREPAAVVPLSIEDDQQEGAGASAGTETALPLEGTWRSRSDAKFEREFSADGSVEDRYEGAVTVSGTWDVVDGPELADTGFPAPDAGTRVLRIAFPEEVLYFAIDDLTADSLSLAYLGAGGSLEFERVD